MAYVPNSGSVVAFQSDATKLNATTFQQAGSVLAVSGSFSPAGNQSVSGTVGASVIGLTPVGINVGGNPVTTANPVPVQPPASGSLPVTIVGSTLAMQGTNPWIITGSVQGSFSPAANQSVSGTVQAELLSTNASIITVGGGTTGNSSVQVVGQMPPQSVSGVGTFNINPVGNGSIISTLVNSSVTALQGTNPWNVQLTSGSILTTSGNSSVQLLAGNNAIGSVTALQGTNPWTINGTVTSNPSPASVQLLAGTNAIGSVTALQGTNPWTVQLTSGSVITSGGNSSVQVVGLMPAQSVSGVGLFNINPVGNGSLVAVLTRSSVAVLQGTNPWITVVQANSIAGTYVEDSAHTTGDRGLYVMQVRNDNMTSVTSANGDYSPIAGGPIGETIVANSPITKWFTGATSVMYGTSVQVVAPPGTSVFSYITGINVINESANASRVTITQGRGGVPASMLTWAIAPAGGGSNAIFRNPIRVLDNNGISASISGVSSVYITITGFNANT